MSISLTATGWNQTALVLASPTTNTVWGGYDRLLMDIYIPPAAWNSWGKIQFVAGIASSAWVPALNGSGEVNLASGMNHLAFTFDWANGTIGKTDPITDLNIIFNSDIKTGQAFYIDNIRLENCD